MSFSQKCVTLIFLLVFAASSAKAQSYYSLTSAQIERLKAVKEQLQDVDTQSLEASIHELERSPRPLINLEMKEAEARTFTEIAQSFDVQTQHKKTWLYSMVCLNMAYLQFGGDEGRYGSTTELNRLIRKTLIKYLPPDVLTTSGSLYILK